MKLEKAEKRAKARLIVYEFFVSASHFFLWSHTNATACMRPDHGKIRGVLNLS